MSLPAPTGDGEVVHSRRKVVLATPSSVLHRPRMADWAGFYAATAAHGVAHVRSGAGFALTERMLRYRARAEGWATPFPLTLLLPGRTVDDPLTLLAAALVAVGFPAFAATESALWLHGILPDRDAPRRPQLLLPHDRRYRPELRRSIEVIRSRRLPVEHLTDVRGLGSTTIARAIVDLAERGASRARLRGLAIRARRLGATSIAEDLAGCLEAFGAGRQGRRVVTLVIADLAGDGADSAPEFRWRALLRAEGIEAWPAPFPWRCPDRVMVHLDVAVPHAWVTIEHDGPAHLGPRAFRIDRLRWNQISREWDVVHATDEDLVNPGRVLAEIRYRLAKADPARPPCPPAPCDCEVCMRP